MTDVNNEPSDVDLISRVLKEIKTVAVVGLSPKTDRPSHEVASYLQSHGYTIVPVHPQADRILGCQVYRRLEDIPYPVDCVDVFRRSEDTVEIAESAVRIGARVLWLQLGVHNEVTKSIAEAGALTVIMDRCMKQEIEKRL